MNKTLSLLIYLFVFVADLVLVFMENIDLRYITKPLLMPALMLLFYNQTKDQQSSLKKWMLMALLFSWAGDVLLMFDSVNGNFFIFGLIGFLLAHICYILLFELIITKEQLKKNFWLFLPVMAYYIALIGFLSPKLEAMSIPVRVYGIVISYMLIQSLQTYRLSNRAVAMFFILGALLFIISDSLLAINKFHTSFEHAGIAVMLTYGVAQLLITLGTIKYFTSKPKQ